MEHGYEEGDACNRSGCKGVIEASHEPDGCCSCHINPPCGYCTTYRECCPVCGWHAKDDPFPGYDAEHDSAWGITVLSRSRDLDPTKIDWRTHMHSSSSQLCEGVYPLGTTQAEVRKFVDGTFGGRFESFGNGKFRFIAYTD